VGAAQILRQVGRNPFKFRLDIIASTFAFITLGSLAIDPMIQQILSTPLQDFQLENSTAFIESSHAYISNTTIAIADGTFHNAIKRESSSLHVTSDVVILIVCC
jgi:hypothetical protein